jgi:2-polyprenyl-3-methyl-5-hydroxy-6-metoxy-1,4-benzoquinol methylase
MNDKIEAAADAPQAAQVAQAEEARYDAFYYQNCCGKPYERSAAVLGEFNAIAEKIVRHIQPKTVLDAGCAFGFLVEGLRDRGVEAYGFDISDYAISNVREDIRPYCWEGSIFDAFPQRYDLIVCMEVVEHLPRNEAERAIDNLCRHADDIIFTSTPIDYREYTHYNVRQPDYWAGLFAERGFFRDWEMDMSFIMPWAMRVRRTNEPAHRAIPPYERRLWEVTQEIDTLRGMVGEQRDLGEELERVRAHRAAVEADQESQRAEIAKLQADNAALRAEIDRLVPVERERNEILASRSWALAQRFARLSAAVRGKRG